MFRNPDGTDLLDPVIGNGSSGFVVLREGKAVKLPFNYTDCPGDAELNEYLNEQSIETIQREQEVYRRLGNCEGVVQCLGLSGLSIQMEFMANGNLDQYLQRVRPSKAVQLAWFCEMARTLARIHDLRVLVTDISARNFLLSENLSVKVSDFSNSTLLPLDCDMQTIEDNGESIYTDIAELGAVMYEVITGVKCKFEIYTYHPTGPATAEWPRREDLPNTQDIWLGSILEKCWTKGSFRTSHHLAAALDLVVPLKSTENERKTTAEFPFRYFRSEPVTLVLSVLTAASLLFALLRPEPRGLVQSLRARAGPILGWSIGAGWSKTTP